MPGFTKVENRILQKYISDPKLSNSLASIRGVMESIWANDAPRIVQNYTDHGIEHSERIAYFVEKLLQVNPDAEFSEQEIYLLLAGVYLHDIGMQCDVVEYPAIKERAEDEDLDAKFDKEFTAETTNGYSSEEQNEIRKNHHLLSAAWIDYLYKGNDPELSPAIKSLPYDLVDDLMDVCKFHSKLPISDCPDSFNSDPNSRKKMVAALLRFADELDISNTRVNIGTAKIFAIYPDNSVYWWLHNYTKVNFVDPNKIRLKVHLHPEDFESYGSFVREEYITHFKSKNQLVLDALVEQNISLVIDTNSDVVAHKRAEKFPPEITAVLDKKIQESDLSPNSQIQVIAKNSDSKPIEILPPQTIKEVNEGISNIPHLRNPRFTGREDKLKQIHEALISNNAVALSQPVAVCGLGGIGKTQTAIEYTYRYRDEYGFIFWVKADSTDSIISDYVGIAKSLNLPVKNDSDQNTIVAAVLNWFRTNEDWLLIIDNADDPSFVKDFLPPSPKGHILLTSRARVFDALGITSLVEMEEMYPDEAKNFLLKRTARVDPDQQEIEALEKLIHELGYLPLALEQAGAYIYANNSSFKDYLISYKKRGLKLLEKSLIDKSKYPESISTTWLMNFDEVKKNSEVSADILFASAFLNPHKIPAEIFCKGAEKLGSLISAEFSDVDTDPLVFDEVLKPLWQYSLIDRDAGCHTYDIHRLVQAVLRDGMKNDEQYLWAERVIKAVNCAFPEVEYKNWELCDKLLPHALTCAEYIKQWGLETEESSKLLNASGSYLHKRARFKESEPFLKSSLEIRKKVLEPEHFDLSESFNNLAELYKDLARYSEAEPLYARALEIRENVLNPDNPAIAESLNNLAELFTILARYSEAESLCVRALEIRENVLNPDDPDIAESLSNLAGVYRDLGRYSEAEPLYTRALGITEKALGPEHPDVGTFLNNLAVVYQDLGRSSEAEPLNIRSLRITEKALGPEHPIVGTCLNNLALVYQDLGRSSEAESLNIRALRITEKALGPEHPDVGIRLNNLAGVYQDLGRSSEAESLYTRALGITEKALGSEHPDVGIRLKNLAQFFRNQNKYLKARPYYERAIKVVEKTKGENSLDFADLLKSYASLLNNMKRNREATRISKRVTKIRSNIKKGNEK
ncbi:hypothetical protein MSMTP_1877 [Methanosarcina sp. MTP4]|uniref:tetratricopeptide repeat protein n=1 Tax=Methanosarcina sp. MTP4 TaxID=1434100 RepID=UPI000616183E|nr:tetratricopeptide repeat protein [Methanosarcina sp. MTP4]AKB25346.1 hypothetical protein MSMTP_1877 [Methanosarcina sp. MTP4]